MANKCIEVNLQDRGKGYLFHCPGCGNNHLYYTEPWTKPDGTPGPVWSFNGDREKPTFRASYLIPGMCHSFVTDGKIQFLADCVHDLAGQTIELPDTTYE